MAIEAGSVKLIDNSAQIKEMMEQAKARALEAIGLQAEGYAKKLCPTDTGLLKNSITHTTSTNAGETLKYTPEMQKKGQKAQKQKVSTNEKDVVYIGTNVFYAPYVELGSSRPKKGPRPFLKPAATEHSDEYKAIIKKYMQQG